MMASILYLGLYAWHFFLPGYLIVRLLAIRRGTFLLSVAGSYALLMLNLMPLEWFKAPLWAFALAVNLQIALLLAANVFAGYRRGGGWPSFWHPAGNRRGRPAGGGPSLSHGFSRWWAPLAIVAGVGAYLAWAGPYLELPADPWGHIVRFLEARQNILHPIVYVPRGMVARPDSWLEFVMGQGGHWYILQSLFCRWSGLAVPDLPGPLTLANTLVFCLSIYWFAMFLWSGQRVRLRRKVQASLLAVIFTAVWLGINIFAYVRYYALAPGMLNYVLYLAAVILMLDYFRARSWRGQALWMLPLLLLTMNVVHTQEALFACFMGLGILLVLEGRGVISRVAAIRGQKSGITLKAAMESARAPAAKMLKVHVFLGLGLAAFGLLFYFSIHRPMASYSAFVLRPLFNGEWLGQQWLIQPLTGQFAQVLTWWGVLVYGLFLLHLRYFKRQPFILAGMLMPCLIVFNPLTILVMARWMFDPGAIYRFNYMLPLPFVAGFLAVRFWGEISSGMRQLFHSRSLGKRPPDRSGPPARGMLGRVTMAGRGIWSAGALLGLIVLLTPWEPLVGNRSLSRFYTLQPVAEGNDQRRWGDLIAWLRQDPQVRVLTDGYSAMLLNMAGVKVMSGGWWIAPEKPGADRLALLRNLDRQHDWRLVVNRRNGDFSLNGARSGHWCGDALMHFAAAYPDDLLLFVKGHPELFREIWSRDQIQVYDIVESRVWE